MEQEKIMLDLETMGIGSDAAIIAIGAVRFDPHEVHDKFYRVVDLQSSLDLGLQMDASTVLWWMKQGTQARAQFEIEGIPLLSCLARFASWIGKDAVVWGNGADFDNAILATAYRMAGITVPWSHRASRCYRTIAAELGEDTPMKRVGTHHCAVDDAESQALHLIAIMRRH